MTFIPVINKDDGDGLSGNEWDTYIKDNFNKGVSRPIAETVLGAASSNITFSSIAADWSHLLLYVTGRSDGAVAATTVNVQFNADATGYDRQHVEGSAAAVTAAENLNATSLQIGSFPGASAGANKAGVIVAFIPSYKATVFQKSCITLYGRAQGVTSGDLIIGARLGQWRNTAAITQIAITLGTGNMITGSSATLYGLGGI